MGLSYFYHCLAVVTLTVPFVLADGDMTTSKSTFRILREGHGPGRDLVDVIWRTRSGQEIGEVQIPVSGIGRLGPVSVTLQAMATIPNAMEWDAREWQWWRNCPFDAGEKRPRGIAVAKGGADYGPGVIRAWSQYVCDGVETTQEWFFSDLEASEPARYDCLITVHNLRAETLEEYGQFFASYTALNQDKGHFYVNQDGQLVNFKEEGAGHLDYYVTAASSPFEKSGHVPHCPRGGGLIKATWKYPISISQPSDDGYRHVVMSQQSRTSAIVQGLEGVAQDYLIYPPGRHLEPGESFRVHVRHMLIKQPQPQLLDALDRLWRQFMNDHERVYRISKLEPGSFKYQADKPRSPGARRSPTWNQIAYHSAATPIVADANHEPTGSVIIIGAAAEDQVLTAFNNLADANGLGELTYQRKRDGAPIDGATGTTYTLTEADVGTVITVTASYIDGQGETRKCDLCGNRDDRRHATDSRRPWRRRRRCGFSGFLCDGIPLHRDLGTQHGW